MTSVDTYAITRGCGTKKRYATEELAKASSTEAWFRRKVSTRTYACTVCGGWHLTSVNAPPMMEPGYAVPKMSAREQARRRELRKRRR